MESTPTNASGGMKGSIMKIVLGLVVGLVVGAGLMRTMQGGNPPSTASSEPTSDSLAELDRRQQISYGIGYGLAYEVAAGLAYDEVDVDAALLAQGLGDGMAGRSPKLEPAKLEQLMMRLHAEVAERAAEKLKNDSPEFAALCARNLEASQVFLAEQIKRPDAKVDPAGFVYEVLETGDGPSPTATDKVVVAGRATLADGTVVFESDAAEVYVDTVTEGAQMVLPQMKVGDRWRVVVPPNLAHGVAGKPPLIGPNMALVYDVTLLEIK